jgi:hypothetical protein
MATAKNVMIGEGFLTAGRVIPAAQWQDGYTKVYERLKNKIKVRTLTLRVIPGLSCLQSLIFR